MKNRSHAAQRNPDSGTTTFGEFGPKRFQQIPLMIWIASGCSPVAERPTKVAVGFNPRFHGREVIASRRDA